MSSLGSRFQLETWRRGAPVRVTAAQLVILAAVVPSALSGRFGSVRTSLLLCLAAAVWSLAALRPALRRRAPVMAVFTAGVAAISFVLVVRDPWFGFYAYAGYAYSIVLLPWPWQLSGVVAERQRMAREIHDTLAQGLTGIITQLQAAGHAAGEPAQWRTHFAAATRLARESLAEARRSVGALRPEPLQTGRLSEALAGVAGRWSQLHGIEVTVTTTGTTRPTRPEAEDALLRAGQEALANVARHAQATRVGVTLSYLDHEVAL